LGKIALMAAGRLEMSGVGSYLRQGSNCSLQVEAAQALGSAPFGLTIPEGVI